MGSNPSYFKGDENLTVEQVSWNDTQVFINKLNEINNAYTYRLPTEAEWEYASRAGSKSDNYTQDVNDIGWYTGNSGQKTHRVGGKQANAFGLYDMSGNVYEWCSDWYHSNYAGAPADGSAWVSGGEQNYRVLRGGSLNNLAFHLLRFSDRLDGWSSLSNYDWGFRLVAVVRTQ